MGAAARAVRFMGIQPADRPWRGSCADRVDEQNLIGSETDDGAKTILRRMATVDEEQVFARLHDLLKAVDDCRAGTIIAAQGLTYAYDSESRRRGARSVQDPAQFQIPERVVQYLPAPHKEW